MQSNREEKVSLWSIVGLVEKISRVLALKFLHWEKETQNSDKNFPWKQNKHWKVSVNRSELKCWGRGTIRSEKFPCCDPLCHRLFHNWIYLVFACDKKRQRKSFDTVQSVSVLKNCEEILQVAKFHCSSFLTGIGMVIELSTNQILRKYEFWSNEKYLAWKCEIHF